LSIQNSLSGKWSDLLLARVGRGERALASSSSSLLSLQVYEPQLRARLGTTAHFYEVVVLKLDLLLAGDDARVGRCERALDAQPVLEECHRCKHPQSRLKRKAGERF